MTRTDQTPAGLTAHGQPGHDAATGGESAPGGPGPAGAQPVGGADAARPDAAFPSWLLHARTRPTVRSDLRRADVPVTQDRAYRHLARFWSGAPWLRTPVLLVAAAAAANDRIVQADGVSLGTLARSLVNRRVLSETTVAARLLAVQRMDLPVAHRHLRPLLQAAAANGPSSLDWAGLCRLYRSWDHPDLEVRRNTRLRLLEQFHG